MRNEMVNCNRKLWMPFVFLYERNFTAMGAHAYAELWEDGRHSPFCFRKVGQEDGFVACHSPVLGGSWTIYECEKSVCSAGQPVGRCRQGKAAPLYGAVHIGVGPMRCLHPARRDDVTKAGPAQVVA